MGITGVDALSQSLKTAGYKTTSVKDGEANFTGYIGALDSGIKEQLVLKTDEQKKMRDEIASLFKDKNNYTHAQLQKLCKERFGFNVNIGYEKTSYITDNKFNGQNNTQAHQGSIAMLTITDPASGQTIKIADANGNGAIEAEELFANELLQGIGNDIQAAAQTPGGAGEIPSLDTSVADAQRELQERLLKQQEEFEQKMAQLEEQFKEQLALMEAKMNALKENLSVEKEVAEDFSKQGYDVFSQKELLAYAMNLVDESEYEKGTNEYAQAANKKLEELMGSSWVKQTSDGKYAVRR